MRVCERGGRRERQKRTWQIKRWKEKDKEREKEREGESNRRREKEIYVQLCWKTTVFNSQRCLTNTGIEKLNNI